VRAPEEIELSKGAGNRFEALAWQQKVDPTRFLPLFISEDAAAQTRQGQSEAVRRFESIYSPELVSGDVVFTDYELVSGKR
jgi:hypothetical protein